MSSLAAFAAGNGVGLIGVIASARCAVPADSISVATAASPSKRIELVRASKTLSMEFSLNLNGSIAAQRRSHRCSIAVAPKIKLGTAT
jgi:hypothetical protein